MSMRDYSGEVVPIDAHYRELKEWLLSDEKSTKSPTIMRMTAKILRDLADIADARAVLAAAVQA